MRMKGVLWLASVVLCWTVVCSDFKVDRDGIEETTEFKDYLTNLLRSENLWREEDVAEKGKLDDSCGDDGDKPCGDNLACHPTEKKCKECVCEGENTVCSFTEDGAKDCPCKDGFAEKTTDGNTVCAECNCGPNGECSFGDKGAKMCTCEGIYQNYKNETCKECQCGAHEVCSLKEDGKPDCTVCENGYARKTTGDVSECAECKCGAHEVCSFKEDGKADCTVCENGYARKTTGDVSECAECNCGPNGKCSFDGKGGKTCTCGIGYKNYLNQTCNECKCTGAHVVCSLDDDGSANCALCEDGFARKSLGNKECADCNCGVKGKCSFDDKDKKMCTCGDGYQNYKNETCKECKCVGANQVCSLKDDGNPSCSCEKGYLEKATAEGGKECAECNCGDKGTCSFDGSGKKMCKCEEGFLNHKNETCKECKCVGDNKVCSLNEDGNANCACKKGYSEKTIDGNQVCAECNCGPNGTCSFDATGNKLCSCDEGFLNFKNEICKACKCGPNAKCSLTADGNPNCTCNEGFKEKTVGQVKICAATCKDNTECSHGAQCKENLCDCPSGLTGDKCETVTDCVTGKYKDCQGSGGTCKFSGNQAVCECPAGKKLNSTKCDDCDCGQYGTCGIGSDGRKICTCNAKYMERNGICDECDCGDKGTCSFVAGIKTCKCNPKTADNNGKCEDCNCGDKGTCSFENGNKKCDCNPKTADKNGICADCDCGENGVCSFVSNNRTCTCHTGFVEHKGICKKCDCGPYGSCKIGDNNEEVCTCDKGYKEKIKEGKCAECDCGENGECNFNDNDEKVCKCKENYLPFKNQCVECKCGANAKCSLTEAGNAKCTCNQGYAEKGNVCVATCQKDQDCRNGAKCKDNFCDCVSGLTGDKCETITDCVTGTYKDCQSSGGKCIFNVTEAVCSCPSDKKLHENKCRKKCEKNENCQNGAECVQQFCDCKRGTSGDLCETLVECKDLNCDKINAKCSYNVSNTETTCVCNVKTAVYRNGKCMGSCVNETQCKNGGKCNDNFCDCLPDTSGEFCDNVDKCGPLECDKIKAKCVYDIPNQKATCLCNDANYLYSDSKCIEKCTEQKKCNHGGECLGNLCRCKPGTSGDLCGTIDNCAALNCSGINADCTYDVKAEAATCVCKDTTMIYKDRQCQPKWCETGCNTAVSDCKFKDGVGYCVCKVNTTYYDYSGDGVCRDVDKCLLEVKCRDDQKCENGVCKCLPEYDTINGTICERKTLCSSNPCFTGATCSENTLGHYVCTCDSATSFYSSNTGQCEEAICFLSKNRKNCTASCPDGMVRKEGECVPTDETKKCTKDCGVLGWCIKSGEEQKCACDPTYAKELNGTCILNAEKVCASKKAINNQYKCNCAGAYKLSGNGITCEKKTCSDPDVQKECQSKGATCEDNWGSRDLGYECKCPDGYVLDTKGNKGCMDPCSREEVVKECSNTGRVCYVSGDAGYCRCPPTFNFNTVTNRCEPDSKYTYMLKNVPVVAKKYLKSSNFVDKVVLSKDVIESMKQTFPTLTIAHVFNYRLGSKVVDCDVWLQFPENQSKQVESWLFKIVDRKESTDEVLLPPALLLNADKIIEVVEEPLSFCSPSVKQVVCGQGTQCADDQCSCDSGYRRIESTLRVFDSKTIVRCEDIDECSEGNHVCNANSTCVNTLGDYHCMCKAGFKKIEGETQVANKIQCNGLCEPNPCNQGSCQVTKNKVDCTCDPGVSGSWCNRRDPYLPKAKHATTVTGAVLGTLLGVIIILIIVYVVRLKKNTYSEDFAPAPRVDNAEMAERRPMRGVTNRAFQ